VRGVAVDAEIVVEDVLDSASSHLKDLKKRIFEVFSPRKGRQKPEGSKRT
jgi:hypothetical protein